MSRPAAAAGDLAIDGRGLGLKWVLSLAGILLSIALMPLLTQKSAREGNDFNWGPALEVAKLFAAIFITIIPAIATLKAGSDGAMSGILALVTTPDGQPVQSM